MERSEHIISTGWQDLESGDCGGRGGVGGNEPSCYVTDISKLREKAIREDLFKKEREEELLKGRQDYNRHAARQVLVTLRIKTKATLKEIEDKKLWDYFAIKDQDVEILEVIKTRNA